LSEGQYNWSVNCTDTAGNSNLSEVNTLYIDFASPTVNLWLPLNNSLEQSTNVTFKFNASDNISIVSNCSIIVDGVLGTTLYNFSKNQVTYNTSLIIAFDNPGGRVSVSLNAIEELIKRIISRFSEVREVKSRVSVSRKGLHIKVRLILRAEGSIPEVTSRVQDAVKSKIQDTIGIDEPIDVAIYVGKILPDQGKEKHTRPKDAPIYRACRLSFL